MPLRRRTMVLGTIALLLTAGVVGVAVSRRLMTRADYTGIPVSRRGEYPIGADTFLVVNTSTGLVVAQVRRQQAMTAVPLERASVYHQWRIIVDAKQSVWLASSDIGTYVCDVQADGSYLRRAAGVGMADKPTELEAR